MNYHYILIKMAKTKNNDNTKRSEYAEKTDLHYWWGSIMVYPLVPVWQFLKKLNLQLP